MSKKEDARIRYGNIIIPPDSGFFGIPKDLSNLAVGIIFSAFGLWFLLTLIPALNRFSMWVVLIYLIISGSFIMLRLRKGYAGRYKWQEKKMKKLFLKAKKEGLTSYRPGPSGDVPDGSYRLPGLLANTDCSDYIDSFHETFGLLWDPKREVGTVFMSVAAPGLQLLDQKFVDGMVAQWSAFMRAAGTSANLIQVAASVVSTKDSGMRLPLAVAKHRTYAGDSPVPLAARQIMDEVLDLENQALPRIDHTVSLTFSARAVNSEGIAARSKDELADEVATVIKNFKETLSAAAAGTVRLMDAQSITDSFYSAYNPGQAHSIDVARMADGGTNLRWEEAGPTYAEAEKDYYEHSDYYTKSFQMWKPPATLFMEDSLRALLSPDSNLEKKRVTLIYRPLAQDKSHEIALNTVNDALYEGNQKGQKGGSRARVLVQKAEQTEMEMAHGATLVPFTMIVSATTDNPAKFPRISTDVRRAGATGVNLGLREATYTHDAAFALGLGAGIVPRDFKL
ncbi:SCO6880 family protein [Rothia sp. (in: high G+C Gram-positive bacteria)]|uniref:SCO6880 family protein n=1 Tax=Rothia sp. (in: high G+C Gram-positive bacteria) TaxID=1885016 RepID=UPI0032166AC9